MTIKRNVVNQVTKQCPYCKGELQIDPAWIGQKLECPYCSQKFILSDSASEPYEAPTATSVQSALDERTSTTPYAKDQAVGKSSVLANPRRLSIVALSIASLSLIISLISLAVFVISGMRSEPKSDSRQNVILTFDSERNRRFNVPKGCRLVPTDSKNVNLFLQTMPSEGAVVRAFANVSSDYPYEGPYYSYKHWSALLKVCGTDEWKISRGVVAFAEKDSEVGRKLHKVFEKGNDSPCIVYIKLGYKTSFGICYYDIVDIEEVSRE